MGGEGTYPQSASYAPHYSPTDPDTAYTETIPTPGPPPDNAT